MNQEDLLRERIIFFDGHCNLCNYFINFIIKRDKKRLLKYASLQGKTADIILKNHPKRKGLSTVILYDAGNLYFESKAVISILNFLDGGWRIFRLLAFFPSFSRDFFYKLVSKYRYLIFKKTKTCQIPLPEERQYFLE